MRNIYFCKSFHTIEITKILQKSLAARDLVIICPPTVSYVDFFISCLPAGYCHYIGNWDLAQLPKQIENGVAYPDDPVLGLFTTGTTRESPKLVLYSTNNLKLAVAEILKLFIHRPITHIFCYPQPFHVFGAIMGYVASILTHIELIFLEGPYGPFFHQRWLDIDAGQRAGLLTLGTPAHFQDLRYYAKSKKAKIQRSYGSIVGGALVTQELWDLKQRDLKIEYPSSGYGCTELSLGVTHLTPGERPKEDGVIGQLLPHIEAKLQECGLLVTGPAVACAVVENGEITFPASYLMKDRLMRLDDGSLKFLGRASPILNRGGEKFILSDIERLLKGKIKKELICVAIDCPRLGEKLGVLCLDEKSVSPIKNVLKNHFGPSLASAHIRHIDRFPLNGQAKVDLKKCKEILRHA